MIATQSTSSTWKHVVCQDVIDVRDGTHDTPAQVVEGIPLITSKNLKPEGIDFEDVSYISEADYLEIEKRSGVDDGDVLFAMIGTIGNPVIVRKDRRFSIKNVALFKLKGSPVLPAFFKSLLSTEIIRRQLDKALRGGNQKFVSLNVLRNVVIPLPPLEEQRRIAEVLDRAEALRAKRRAALAQLDSLIQTLFVHAFGDPLTNPKRIKTAKLGSLCVRVTDGTHQPPKWSAKGHPFLFVSNIVSGEIKFDTEKFISDETHAELTRRCPIEVGDVLYSTVGSYGVPAIVRSERRFAFQRHIAHLKPERTLLDTQFLAAMLASPPLKRQADRAAKGVAQKTVNLSEIREFTVFQPPMHLQREFGRRVQAVEKLKTAQRASLAELDALFASLQHRAFRGEL